MMSAPELVVLVDNAANPIGTALKSEVHGSETPLHLAFSCYVFNDSGELLLSRRAISKQTWAGVWTNSVCGHPAPGESFEDAIQRRAQLELGLKVDHIQCELPDFSYRAIDASGVVENEICPVFIAHTSDTPNVFPDEVCEWAWTSPDALETSFTATPFVFSPWLREQLPLLLSRGSLKKGATLA